VRIGHLVEHHQTPGADEVAEVAFGERVAVQQTSLMDGIPAQQAGQPARVDLLLSWRGAKVAKFERNEAALQHRDDWSR
jgi:hypothetical protein